ncbi:hypothetical protein QTN25_009789 [Entamoeba marina]
MNTKQIDSYSMLIVSKYFYSKDDYINVICVNSKFKETTEKLRYNPIPITSLKLFPKIQTQYLYSNKEKKIYGLNRYEIWYEITYNNYLKMKEKGIICRHVKYTRQNVVRYGKLIPDGVTVLNLNCYSSVILKKITIPNCVTSIENQCFSNCSYLEDVILSNGLTTLSQSCFSRCIRLTSIDIPSSIKSLKDKCFFSCDSLKTISIPNCVTSIGSYCFHSCTSLQSIILPETVLTLQPFLFCFCKSLTNIELPSSLNSIGESCFLACINLSIITLPSSLKTIGKNCFHSCTNLTTIICLGDTHISSNLFESRKRLTITHKNKEHHYNMF